MKPLDSQDRSLRVTVALALIAMFMLPPDFLAAHLEDRIVAVVNSDLIMLSEVRREVEPERVRMARQHPGEDLAQRLKLAESMALTRMIERKLQLQEAKTKKIEISDQEVKQAAEQMKQRGETVDLSNPLDVKRVRDQLTLARVVDVVVRSTITVGESEMKRYYDAHRDRFALPEEYTLSQILIQPRAPDEVAEALTKARQAMEDLKHGEKFADVAARYSDAPNALQGGHLGLVRQGEFLPAIERAIATLVPGGISDIIESPEGFHIIRVEEKSPRQFRPFDDVKFEIQGLIFQQKSEDVYQTWLNGLKNKAHIEIKF
ncbi:MAG TPA: peptidyl-prolyl cis-trans isomerase [Nitrospira sp.]|jgi:parvulin-like peptidyl-prolyl isomerase|nr:peptidyl-prolyl cis-trans isomerase [Nitrospira sp.]